MSSVCSGHYVIYFCMEYMFCICSYVMMLHIFSEWNMNLKIVRITKNIPNLLFFVNADAWLTLLSQEVSGMICCKTLDITLLFMYAE